MMDNSCSQNWVEILLNKENVVVLEGDANELPSYAETYDSPLYCLYICHSGSVDVLYDAKERHFRRFSVAVVYPHHNLKIKNPSSDYRFTKVFVSYRHLEKMAILNMHTLRFFQELEPQFELTESQYLAVMDAVNTLRHALSIQSDMSEMMSDYSLLVLIGILASFRKDNEGDAMLHKAYLSPRLYKEVLNNCQQHRDVDYYAAKFCLTPKHFSTVIKQETGMSVRHWIHQILVAKAKMILQTESSSTIQDISSRLGFKDQTSFSRYFKRETGLTPTEYRQQVKAGKDFKDENTII